MLKCTEVREFCLQHIGRDNLLNPYNDTSTV